MKVKNRRKNDVFGIMRGVFYSSLRAVSKWRQVKKWRIGR